MATNDKELQMLAKAADEFAKKELAPLVGETDKHPDPAVIGELLQKAFDLDFFHTLLPEDLDGMGMGTRALGTLLDPICQVDSSFGVLLFANIFSYELMLAAGWHEEIKAITAANDAPGAFLVACPVFENPTETDIGLQAEKQGDIYRLSGRVDYLVPDLAPQALVPALIAGQKDVTFFLVDTNAPGLTVGEPVLTLGAHACQGVDITMEGVTAVPVGEEAKGPVYFAKASDRLQTAAAAMALGVMKGSFKEGFDYASRREQGGRTTVNWSEMQMILAEFALRIQMAEMAVAQSTQAVDSGAKGWQQASLAAAVQVGAMACETTTDGIQVMGGVGYMKDFGQEKRFRDARHIQALLGMTHMRKLRFIRQYIK